MATPDPEQHVPTAGPTFNVVEEGARNTGQAGDANHNRVTIQAVVDRCRDAGGGVVELPPGVYHIDAPILVWSNVTVRGHGPDTVVRNEYQTGSGQYLTSCCFLQGSYHPRNCATWQRDSIATPSGEEITTVTRTTTTLAIAVGDLVMVHDVHDAEGTREKYLRRVVAVNGNDVTVHRPLSRFTGTSSSYFITKGEGGSIRFNPPAGEYVTPTYFAERCAVENLAVYSTGAWQARHACLDSVVRDITVLRSNALIYGNAFEGCLIENISGKYGSRVIEIAEGGANNLCRNIVAEQDGSPIDPSDPLIKLGAGSTLEDFDFTDRTTAARTNMYLSLKAADQTVRRGVLRVNDPATPILSLRGERGLVEDVTIEVEGQMNTDLIRLVDATDAIVRNVSRRGGAGYAPGNHTVRVRAGCRRVRVEGIDDPDGSVSWQDGPGREDEVSFGDVSWGVEPGSGAGTSAGVRRAEVPAARRPRSPLRRGRAQPRQAKAKGQGRGRGRFGLRRDRGRG
jgi:hypothetical protein